MRLKNVASREIVQADVIAKQFDGEINHRDQTAIVRSSLNETDVQQLRERHGPDERVQSSHEHVCQLVSPNKRKNPRHVGRFLKESQQETRDFSKSTDIVHCIESVLSRKLSHLMDEHGKMIQRKNLRGIISLKRFQAYEKAAAG